MSYDIFAGRDEAFRFGYAAFFDGYIANFYDPNGSDEENWKYKEWQHGFDVAFTETQLFWEAKRLFEAA